jgi:hypothetical protein
MFVGHHRLMTLSSRGGVPAFGAAASGAVVVVFVDATGGCDGSSPGLWPLPGSSLTPDFSPLSPAAWCCQANGRTAVNEDNSIEA